MRVVFFTNNFFPRIGGVGVSVQTLCEGLKKMKHSVMVIAPEYRSRFEHRPLEPCIARVHSFRFWWLRHLSLPLPFFNIHRIQRWMVSFKPDILHVHHPWLLGQVGLQLGKHLHLPTVLTYHTFYEHYLRAGPIFRWFRGPIIRSALRACELSSAVIAPTSAVGKMLRDHGVQTRISIIPTGVNLEQFSYSMNEAKIDDLRRDFAIPLNHRILLYVGRLSSEKNTEMLLSAFARLRELRPRTTLLLVGAAGAPAFWKRRFDALGLADAVRWTGEQPHHRMPHFYHLADLFVFPSITDTQGIVLYEALACGLPVVACDSPAAQSLLRSLKAGMEICEPHPSDLALSMLKALEGNREPEPFSSSPAFLSSSLMIQNVVRLYQSLISKPQ